jgi:hypothetical protein
MDPNDDKKTDKGYGRRPLWQWILIYIVAAIIITASFTFCSFTIAAVAQLAIRFLWYPNANASLRAKS